MSTVKVLQILGGGSSIGGVERMLLNYYENIDRDSIVFDFCFVRENTFPLVEAQYGDLLKKSKIYELTAFKGKSDFLGYLSAVFKIASIISKNDYSIVHINAGRPALLVVGLLASLATNVQIKIMHSHSTDPYIKNSFRKKWFMFFIGKFLSSFSDYLFSCSIDAGTYMFGKDVLKDTRFFEVKNAIDITKYKFNLTVRNRIREIYNVDKRTILYGHVGRFSKEKNHRFLIDVFKNIHKAQANSILWLIGDGEMRKEIEDYVLVQDIKDSVLFLGSRSDVPDLLQALDVMIFPSLYEGLSVTLIEAQCSGVVVFASNNISKEHKITPLFNFLNLNIGPQMWADYIVKCYPRVIVKQDVVKQIIDSGYCVKSAAKDLGKIYLDSIKHISINL